jgi:ABC-2 type transport system permease protein
MLRAIRSELIRMNRPPFLFGSVGLMAAFASLATVLAFASAGKTGMGPAQYIPTEKALVASDGFMVGFGLLATIAGVVALSFWAVSVASDYGTGLIRLLVQAEPRRYRLLVGKLGALSVLTVAGTLAATLAAAGTAWVIAPMFDVSTAAWGTDVLKTIAESFMHLSLSTVVWGVVGLTIATISRSSAVAISVGLGYVLLIENMVLLVAEDAADKLPGAVLGALATGGTATIEFGSALALGAAYVLAGIIISGVILQRREITY